MELVKALLQTYRETNGEQPKQRQPASLFECPGCNSVYIGIEKQACLSCDRSVVPISNESELGLV